MEVLEPPMTSCGPIRLWCILFGLSSAAAVAATPPAGPGLIPAPLEAHWAVGVVKLNEGAKITVSDRTPRMVEIAEILREGLREQAGVAANLEGREALGAPVVIRLELRPGLVGPAGEPEGYRLTLDDTIVVAAADVQGVLWGVQTLLQAVNPGDGNPTVAKGEIVDRPSRGWRGLKLDPVSSWLDPDFVWRTIRVMSAYKLNVLHLQLTDDAAWRFESKAWPKCNRSGEPRYSQAELVEMVRFAARYGVEIVPGLELPGHAMTAVNAYPELDCQHQLRTGADAVICVGRPFATQFIDRVVTEIAQIFPSRYIDFGGNAPFSTQRWAACPDCQARMKQRGVSSAEAYYHTFINELNEIARRHGRTAIMANDGIRPGVEPMPAKDIVIDAGTKPEEIGPLASSGYRLLNSPGGLTTFSSSEWRDGLPMPAVLGWDATKIPLAAVKRGDTTATFTALPSTAKILGGHASAMASEQRLLERRLYPRLLAFAEDLWSEGRAHPVPQFHSRFLSGHLARLHRIGVADESALPVEKLFAGTANETIKTAGAKDRTLTSPRAYRDVAVTFEYRRAIASDEIGIRVRNGPQGGIPIRLRSSSAGPATAALGAGWNRCEIVARGNVVSLTIDGVLATSVVDASPRAGVIVFTSGEDGHEFRNVEVRNLDGAR